MEESDEKEEKKEEAKTVESLEEKMEKVVIEKEDLVSGILCIQMSDIAIS